jgi:hypothetical protein
MLQCSMDIPMAPIIAVDGYNYSVVVAYAFTVHQNIESFQWIFSKLKSRLPNGGELQAIITDEDKAMAAALKAEFPTTTHLLCR